MGDGNICEICRRPAHVLKKCMYCHKSVCPNCFNPPAACIRCHPKKGKSNKNGDLKPKPKPKYLL